MRLHRAIATAVSLGLLQCSGSQAEENVGNPCMPLSEADFQFAGFTIDQETIVTGVPDCGGGVCLVNHFQGRVTCPLGQAPPQPCSGPNDPACGADSTCVTAGTLARGCDPTDATLGQATCIGYGSVCDPKTRSCRCELTQDCPAGTYCDPSTEQCTTYVCHKGGDACQSPGAGSDNQGKACCVPNTDTPIAAPVCGQCAADSNRDAEKAVYCSCRCGPAEGAPAEDDASFCECPAGFECQEIRPYLGLGDPKLTGKYCIKQGTELQSEQQCGAVKGYFNASQCEGISIGGG